MKSYVCLIFWGIILLKVIGVCESSCFTKSECKNYIPKKILRWKGKNYGLEIPVISRTSEELTGEDAKTQATADEVGRPNMKSQVNRMIKENKKSKLPDFTIIKLDPISYEIDGQNMLITLSDVKMFNLDGYAFADKDAQYSQKGMYEYGDYNIEPEIYAQIEKQLEDNQKANKKDKDFEAFFERIKTDKIPGKYILERRDCKWKITIKAKFLTQQKKGEKPIIIKTNFKIQPDMMKTQPDGIKIQPEPLRARGAAEIEIRDFSFEISMDITHIDDPLRPYLDDNIKSDNLVPDFNLIYDMAAIKVKNIELYFYDKDNEISIETDNELEDVNTGAPTEAEVKQMEKEKEEQEKTNPSKKSKQTKKENLNKDKNLQTRVESHLGVLIDLIKTQKDEIRKRLCRNLLPKMAWKVMHMDTKKKLPRLFYQILAYEDDFKEKVRLPKFTAKDWVNLGWDFAGAKIMNAATSVTNFIGSKLPFRSFSAPAKLERTDNDEEDKD